MPKVSVIIPSYNHAPYLVQRIDSVLNQTFQDFELVILDDCSTDNSKEIIETYRTHKKISYIVFNQENSGSPFKQWQKGIELAKGEYIWIAESDDYSDIHFLEKLIQEFEDPSVGIVFCNSHWIDDSGEIKKSLSIYNDSFKISGKEEVKRKMLYNSTIQNVSSCIFKKELAIGHLSKITSFKSCGDWLFYILLLTSSNLSFVGEKLNYFRWYHNNVSNKASATDLWLLEQVKMIPFIDFPYLGMSKMKVNSYSFSLFKKVVKSKKLSFQQMTDAIVRLVLASKF
jgi:glycosyltransferase involved in cell wall biosynthesis